MIIKRDKKWFPIIKDMVKMILNICKIIKWEVFLILQETVKLKHWIIGFIIPKYRLLNSDHKLNSVELWTAWNKKSF